jgi:hypothetical protein
MRFAIVDTIAPMAEAAVCTASRGLMRLSGAVGEAWSAGFEDFKNPRNGEPGRATYFSFVVRVG